MNPRNGVKEISRYDLTRVKCTILNFYQILPFKSYIFNDNLFDFIDPTIYLNRYLL